MSLFYIFIAALCFAQPKLCHASRVQGDAAIHLEPFRQLRLGSKSYGEAEAENHAFSENNSI